MANTQGNHLVPLGSGPTMSVYAGRGAAFKVFPTALDRRTRAALEREVAAWRQVPFTRVVHGVEDLADGVTAVCCELCGHSLADRVRRDGPLPIAEVLDLGLVLAEALAAAHALGLVHGGVTAPNVLIRTTGETVLADGGLVARTAFPADPPVDFAAPETVREAVRDTRTDLYGLGAVLFLALTGHVPHPARMGERAEEHLLRVLRAPVPPIDRPDVPAGLADLVHALLSADPDARPADAAARLSRVAGSGFDDFADAAPPPPTPAGGPPGYFSVPPAPPVRLPLAEVKPGDRKEGSGRLGVAAGVVAALGLFAAAPFLLLREDPPAPLPAAPAVSAPPAEAVQIEVVDAVDNVDHVVLTWRSSADLDYLVIIAPEGRPNRRSVELRENTMRIDVEPGLRYCFEVHGTDGYNSYASAPKGIRQATCAR